MYDGHFTKRVRDDFREIVANAFKEALRELVSKRLTSALEATNERPAGEAQAMNGEAEAEALETTVEEIEAFYIVKSIMRTVVKSDRVVMRDAKSYCAILLDDNNHKPLARFHFNRANKYIGIFTNKQEERVRIESVEDIYDHAERLRATAREYASA